MIYTRQPRETSFRATDASSYDATVCPCCRNMERLLVEQIRIVGAIVSTPFHPSIIPLIEPALLDVRLRGRELVSIPPHRRQSADFRNAVREFDVAVEGYCAALIAFDEKDRSGRGGSEGEPQRVFALRQALKTMASYAAVMAEDASTVGPDI